MPYVGPSATRMSRLFLTPRYPVRSDAIHVLVQRRRRSGAVVITPQHRGGRGGLHRATVRPVTRWWIRELGISAFCNSACRDRLLHHQTLFETAAQQLN